MIFLTTGEKIKSLRKRFGMRQQELEDENITRAFISMIETGKRGLSKDTAKNIAEKLSNKAISLNLTLNIDEYYLLRTPAEDAEIYCLDKLNSKPTLDEVDVIINISKKYGLTKVEAEANKVLGDYGFEKKKYTQAFISYMVSLDLYKDTDCKHSVAYLYNRLGECKLEQMDYIEAVSFLNRANYYSVIYKDKMIEKHSLYNLAKTYRFIGRLEDALELLDKYLIMCNKEKDLKCYVHATVLKAECSSLKGNYEKAISILNQLINEIIHEDKEFLWHAYHNLAVIYEKNNDLSESLQLFNEAEALIQDIDNDRLSKTYMQKAKVYHKKKEYDEAIKLCNKGLKLATDFNDTETILGANYVLVNTYTELGDFQSLKNIYIRLLDTLKDEENYKSEVNKIYNRLALLYLEQNDIEMCKKYLHMAS